MLPEHDPVTENDLIAYVDDQLEPARRIAVAGWLAGQPQKAAQVMADLRIKDELRLALLLDEPPLLSETRKAAHRLERALLRGRIVSRLRQVAAVVLLIGAGWVGNEILEPLAVTPSVASAPAPAFVEDAMRAHGTSVIRAAMASQPEAPEYDPDEIRSMTAIVMPSLPDDWHIKDVQIFPSQFGPSVELEAEADELGPVSLFAVRPGSFDVVKPTIAPGEEASAAYFQVGEVAYALVSSGDIQELNHTAERLAETLY